MYQAYERPVMVTAPHHLADYQRYPAGRRPVRTLAMRERFVDERDDMVVKALSWALREPLVWDAAAVQAFLVDHGDRVASRAVERCRTSCNLA